LVWQCRSNWPGQTSFLAERVVPGEVGVRVVRGAPDRGVERVGDPGSGLQVRSSDVAGAKSPLVGREIQSRVDRIGTDVHRSGRVRGVGGEQWVVVERGLGIGLDGTAEARRVTQAQVGGDIDFTPLAAVLDPAVVSVEGTGAQPGLGAVDLGGGR
jgi:hypothetical protein